MPGGVGIVSLNVCMPVVAVLTSTTVTPGEIVSPTARTWPGSGDAPSAPSTRATTTPVTCGSAGGVHVTVRVVPDTWTSTRGAPGPMLSMTQVAFSTGLWLPARSTAK